MTTSAPVALTSFAGVDIPGYRGAFQWPVAARATITPTINGAFDAAGSSRALLQVPYPLTYTGAAAHATDTTQIKTTLDALRALTGAVDQLIMSTTDSTTRWAWARLLNVSPEMTATARGVVTFQTTFQVLSLWNGTAHGAENEVEVLVDPILFANGLYADPTAAQTMASSPANISVTNSGNTAIRDAGIVITAGSANITALKLTIASLCELEYVDTVYAGENLIIDCGARTILNNGVDAFKDWHRTANHATDSWFTFDTGTTTLTVTFTGGSTDSTIIVTYSDGWA